MHTGEAVRPDDDDPAEVALRARMAEALEGLLGALRLEPRGEDRFTVAAEPGRFVRMFGGQLVAQAVVASSSTVPDKRVRSLHAYFVAAGSPDVPVEIAVERVRDGRAVSTRHVTVSQGDRPLLVALASFDAADADEPFAAPAPLAPAPHDVPRLQHWVPGSPSAREQHAANWIDRPPPVDLRVDEPPCFLGGPARTEDRSHWMRVPERLDDDPVLHAALLAYASDYLLLDMALRSHPAPETVAPPSIVSLDHAVWFHLPARFDRWHLHTQSPIALAGDRGLVRGVIHDEDGAHVATVVQDTLIRSGGPS